MAPAWPANAAAAALRLDYPGAAAVIAARVLRRAGAGRRRAPRRRAPRSTKASAVLPLARLGAAVTATAPDAVILARRLDPGEERAGY